MTLQQRKFLLINQLMHTSNPVFIGKVEELVKNSFREEYETNLRPISERELIARSLLSEKDIKAGRVSAQGDVERYFKNRKK